MSPRPTVSRRHLPSSPFSPPAPAAPLPTFAHDDRVSHDSHGLGRVAIVEDSAVVVQFGTRQLRIMAPYHKLTKL